MKRTFIIIIVAVLVGWLVVFEMVPFVKKFMRDGEWLEAEKHGIDGNSVGVYHDSPTSSSTNTTR